MYWYHTVMFLEIIITNYQTTSCLIILLTSCNFLNVMVCFHIIFNWLAKNVFLIDHNIIVICYGYIHYVYYIVLYILFLQLEDNCVFISIRVIIKRLNKSLFTTWKLGSLKKILMLVLYFCWHFWLIFIPINCSFKTRF